MKLRPSTIRARLTLWYVALLGLILLAFSSILYVTLAHGLYQQLDDGLSVAAQEAATALNNDNGVLTLQSPEADVEVNTLRERGLMVRIIDLDGHVLDSAGPLRDLPVPPAGLAAVKKQMPHFDTVVLARDTTLVRVLSVPYLEHGKVTAVLETALTLSAVHATLRQLMFILAFVIPATLGVAILGGLFLANRALSPIDRITRAAQRIGANDLGQRLNLGLPDDEVGRLARTFDGMLARLEDAFRRQQQFTADASHELRTPLAIMKGELGVALSRNRKGDEYRVVLDDMEEEVDRMTVLVEDMLFLARSDNGMPALEVEVTDLAAVLRGVMEQVTAMADQGGIRLSMEVHDELLVEADGAKLVRLFLNLLENALKYTASGGHVAVRMTRCGEMARVAIEDTGAGIPANHLPHIFDRFYRADPARSGAVRGAGIGLAIARWIAQVHGGRIEVVSEPGVGSTFTVYLPLVLTVGGTGV
ncbi:MAG: ATP-binding protein [Herpetosiphon sp.]